MSAANQSPAATAQQADVSANSGAAATAAAVAAQTNAASAQS
jgi:hypothetical protein